MEATKAGKRSVGEDGNSHEQPKRQKVDDQSSLLLGQVEFDGEVVHRDHAEFHKHRYQYATSGKFSNTNPAAIIYAKKDDDHLDIKRAIDYAKANNLSISVRSGGHQYLGFSSTGGSNIQIDMREYNDWDATNIAKSKGSRLIIGPSWRLRDIIEKTTKKGIFFPHGECSGVAVGGHCQTGGYSLFSHSFGLFIDYILWFEIITADKKVRRISRPNKDQPNEDNDDLWFSVLGGSPGNFGIVTRLEVEVLHDEDYQSCKVLFRHIPFTKKALKQSLEIMEETTDNKQLSCNCQYSVMVLSEGAQHRYKFEMDGKSGQNPLERAKNFIKEYFKELKGVIREGILNLALKFLEEGGIPIPVLVIFACYSGVDKTAEGESSGNCWYNDVLNKVDDIEKAALEESRLTHKVMFALMNDFLGLNGKECINLSEVDHHTAWRYDREFQLPFQKRVFNGDSQNLKERGFATWATEKCWELEGKNRNPEVKSTGLKLGCQFIAGGCVGSRQGPSNHPTALGNRNPIANLAAFDFFYKTFRPDDGDTWKKGDEWKEPLEEGLKWLDTGEGSISKTATGLNGKFADLDKRFLYAPWGPEHDPCSSEVNLDSHEMIAKFYSSREDYFRVLKTKKRFDPDHVFTPNCFCVGYSALSEEKKARLKRETNNTTLATLEGQPNHTQFDEHFLPSDCIKCVKKKHLSPARKLLRKISNIWE